MRDDGRMIRAAVLIGCAVLALASSVQAQTVVLGPEGVARSEGLGRAFQTFSIFGGTPGVAAAKFYSNFDLNNFQLPIAHSFDPIEGGYLNGIAPYAELTLDYLGPVDIYLAAIIAAARLMFALKLSAVLS